MSPSLRPDQAERIRHCTVVVEGVVQGVGFRPFVYRLAQRHGLCGSVRNGSHGVLIDVEGDRAELARFLDDLASEAPVVAHPRRVTVHWSESRLEATAFSIETSSREGAPIVFPAPDLAVCAACLRELHDPDDRRHGYPFLNCTACGPRFTIIRGLPYDRERTSMAGFSMCRACRAEYEDPSDRRFHAEPTACPDCGPRLALLDANGLEVDAEDLGDGFGRRADAPLYAAAAALRAGGIVAVKGLGGYHLACDATNAAAVATLRRRKGREAKPFAVMVANLDMARALCVVSAVEAELLASAARPIVLLEKRPGAREVRGPGRRPVPGTGLCQPDVVGNAGEIYSGAALAGGNAGQLYPGPVVADGIAPRLRELGLMLPYTPLHHLLLEAAGVPLVMTSGNGSDEPIVHDDGEAVSRLGPIADLLLVHDRPIQIRCDDSIVRVGGDGPMLIRRARGHVPLALTLPHEAARPILAVGGELKSVFALVRGRDAFLSQHLGDLTDERAWRAWNGTVAHFERLLDVTPAVVAHDMHPGYRTTVYAGSFEGVVRIAVQHHHAHIASCLADNGIDTRVIGVAWDGTGYGADGHVWGGEFLVANLAGYERAGHLQEVPLPGGDAAVREPWRMAAVFLRAAYGDAMQSLELDFVRRLDPAAWRVLLRAIERGLNAPPTSSAGRLFDGVASLLGVRDTVDFEAQAAMELEALVESDVDRLYPFEIVDSGEGFVVRTPDVIRGVVQDLLAEVSPAKIAGRFQATMAEIIGRGCARIRAQRGLCRVALSGGVFQNVALTRAAIARLERAGFEVYTHHQVPPNDGGLALGQAAVAARLDSHTERG